MASFSFFFFAVFFSFQTTAAFMTRSHSQYVTDGCFWRHREMQKRKSCSLALVHVYILRDLSSAIQKRKQSSINSGAFPYHLHTYASTVGDAGLASLWNNNCVPNCSYVASYFVCYIVCKYNVDNYKFNLISTGVTQNWLRMNCLQACARATPQGRFNSRHAPTFIGYLKGTHFECKKIARVFQCKFFVNFFLSACELSTCNLTLTPETISSYASTSASPQAHLAFKFAFPPPTGRSYLWIFTSVFFIWASPRNLWAAYTPLATNWFKNVLCAVFTRKET